MDFYTVVVVLFCYCGWTACVHCEFFVHSVEILDEGFGLDIRFHSDHNIISRKLRATEPKHNKLLLGRFLKLDNFKLSIGTHKMLLIDGGIVVVIEGAIDEDHGFQDVRLEDLQVEG